ncbi:MAG: hypothetical protein U0176_24295 [Bacteroidia bacterium]
MQKPIQVEHWRPKKAVRNGRNGTKKLPGYYWLAYDWENLFMCCFSCNNQKLDALPIAAGKQYASDHQAGTDDISDILFVHPILDDPEEHITFEEEIVKPVRGSLKGQNTIDLCGLDSSETEELRLKHLQLYKKSLVMVELSTTANLTEELAHTLGFYALAELLDFIAEARLFLAKAPTDQGPYAGMVRANFPASAKFEPAIPPSPPPQNITHSGTGDIVMGNKIGRQINMGDGSTYNETNN